MHILSKPERNCRVSGLWKSNVRACSITCTNRTNEQEAARYFRVGVDVSLDILKRSGASGTEARDAFDLAAGYNRLGLALRDAGANDFEAKNTFVEGLSVAPDDMALLINAGVAHQVRDQA